MQLKSNGERMRKEKKPCIFCRGFRLKKVDLILIILIGVIMYWVNQYQLAKLNTQQTQEKINQEVKTNKIQSQ